MNIQIYQRLLFAVATAALLAPSSIVAAEPNLVPWPQSVKLEEGAMPLAARSRIIVQDAALAPLADVLRDDIARIAGLNLAAARGEPAAGDIVLAIDRKLATEAYRLEIGDRATIRGGSYAGVALGSATFLQAMTVGKDNNAVALPRMSIDDAPACGFRGLLIDVARQYHSIASLKGIVRLCRFYKVRYLQLHLTDDESFMFPSRAYPLLNTKNQNGRKSYTLEELKDLVAFADARDVTIIPEYEMPGHSATANRAMHNLFIIANTKPYEHHSSINFCKDEVMRALGTIVGEMCEVFKSSPYFHIGGDEADLALADQNVDFKAAMKKYGLPNQHELYRRFVAQMDEIVKKQGKQMIVWEGFGRGGLVKVPKDIIVMSYEIRFYMPGDLIRDGYQVVNTSWTPLYVVNKNCRPPAEIYVWNLYQFKPYGAKPQERGQIIAPNKNVLGAEMCAWEQPEAMEMPNERHRLPAMIERIWNPSAGKSFGDFERRLTACDARLDCLLKNPGVVEPSSQSQDSKLAPLTGSDTPLKPGMKIAFFGDSITMQGGFIRRLEKALRESPYAKNLNVKLLQHGLNGGRISTIMAGTSPWGSLGGTMQQLLDKEKPDVVVIFAGVNDVWHGAKGTTPEDFEAGLKKMVSLGKASGAKVVLATLATINEKPDGSNPFDAKLDRYAAIELKVAHETGATPVDVRKAFIDYLKAHNIAKNARGHFVEKGILTYDGVHMKPQGDELLSGLLGDGIAKAIKEQGINR